MYNNDEVAQMVADCVNSGQRDERNEDDPMIRSIWEVVTSSHPEKLILRFKNGQHFIIEAREI